MGRLECEACFARVRHGLDERKFHGVLVFQRVRGDTSSNRGGQYPVLRVGCIGLRFEIAGMTERGKRGKWGTYFMIMVRA